VAAPVLIAGQRGCPLAGIALQALLPLFDGELLEVRQTRCESGIVDGGQRAGRGGKYQSAVRQTDIRPRFGPGSGQPVDRFRVGKMRRHEIAAALAGGKIALGPQQIVSGYHRIPGNRQLPGQFAARRQALTGTPDPFDDGEA
jgi:hypothetical protein